jgi:hypothetical protein
MLPVISASRKTILSRATAMTPTPAGIFNQ